MDERHPLISVAETVEVTDLSATEHRMTGTVIRLKQQFLRLRLPQHVAAGTPVKIEGHDTLLLGEVCRVTPEDGAFVADLVLSHSLLGLAELARLHESLRDEPSLRLSPARERSPR